MEKLRELRLVLGWNMKTAAEKIGIPYTTYVSYEKGEREPNSEMLIKLADFYGCSVDYLIGNKKSSPDDDELVEELQMLRDLPERRALLHATRDLTADQVRQMADFLEGMKRQSGNDY